MKIKLILVTWLSLFIALTDAWALPQSESKCDSCLIKVHSLEKPVDLAGNWLFTREDRETNKDVEIDTSDWVLVKAPGPWKKAYNDHEVYRVGWYRGVLEFDPALIGKEVVFLVDSYMSALTFYLDGQQIFHRGERKTSERYYAIQPIPIAFKVTRTHHVITFRIDTILMVGVYQLPFQLREFKDFDFLISFLHFWEGDFRQFAASIILVFSLFFMLIWAKTRFNLYLVTALMGFFQYPFYAAPGDVWATFFNPETLLLIHYLGITTGAALHHYFVQHFYKFYPRVTRINGIFVMLQFCAFVFFIFHMNLEVFQKLRVIWLLNTFFLGVHMVYMLIRSVLQKREGAVIILIGETILVLSGTQDMLLALGKIESFMMMFAGSLFATMCILWYCSNLFANTFVQNKKLLTDMKKMNTVLEEMNDHLEELVLDRTAQLREKSNDILTMLQHLPEGVLTVMQDNKIHHEYSAYLETILGTKDIADRDVMDVLFSNTNLGVDALASLDTVFGACLGEFELNFLMNSHLMIRELDKTLADGTTKHLELTWSPIVNEETEEIDKILICVRDITELRILQTAANLQKRELEIIGQILSVPQEKFQDFLESSRNFIMENEKIIRQTTRKDNEILQELFRNMHTIKGNARTYGLVHLTNIVHEAEQEYDDLRKHPDREWKPELLLQQLASSSRMLDEYALINEKKLGRKGPGRRGSADKFLMIEKERITKSIELLENVDSLEPLKLIQALDRIRATLKILGTTPTREIVSDIVDSLPSLASELGKETPEVTINDHNIFIKNQATGLLKNAFMHIFRNSLDHGIETPAERLKHGKVSQGNIQLDVLIDHGQLLMHYHDDGRGLALSRIRQKALEQGMIFEGDELPLEDLANLIFQSGFSTAEKVTEVSGRGVGLDAVKKFFQKNKGDIMIELLDTSQPDADFIPFQFTLQLPENLAVQVNELELI
ncbi:MAG: Hpt domain-containing protein [SAR324 cluster bacterium]|nr:Hpt domain-containing protein [SAR324 cluster bacterium]